MQRADQLEQQVANLAERLAERDQRLVRITEQLAGEKARYGGLAYDDLRFSARGAVGLQVGRAGFDVEPASPDARRASSLRSGFVTSALEHGADVLKVMDVTRHRRVETLKGYDWRAKAFRDHAGGRFL
jgi:hypothetical protein